MKVNLLILISIFLIGNLTLLYGQKAEVPVDYAVLISGDSPNLDKSYNGGRDRSYDEFWNDAYLMWEIHYTKTGQIADEQSVGSLSYISINQNPVRKSAAITFSTSDPGYVNVTIYDVQGKKVRDILNAYRPAGIHTINFDAENIESGVYFIRLDTKGFSDVRKVIIAK